MKVIDLHAKLSELIEAGRGDDVVLAFWCEYPEGDAGLKPVDLAVYADGRIVIETD